MAGLGCCGSSDINALLLHPALAGSGYLRCRRRGFLCLPIISISPTPEAGFHLLLELRRSVEPQRQAVHILWKHEMDYQELLKDHMRRPLGELAKSVVNRKGEQVDPCAAMCVTGDRTEFVGFLVIFCRVECREI